MIASLGQTVARCRPARPTAVIRPRDSSLEPAFALQLQKLLSNRFAGQLQLFGELCDGRRPLPLERDENRAAAVRKLIDGEDDNLLVRVCTIKRLLAGLFLTRHRSFDIPVLT